MGAVDSALDAFHMTREKRAITPLPWGLVYYTLCEKARGAVWGGAHSASRFVLWLRQRSKPSGEGVLRSDRYCNLVNRDPKSPLAHALEGSEEAEAAAFLPIVIGAFKNDHQQVSTIVLSNGALYKGETLNGLPHGGGAWTLHNPQWPKTVQQAVLKLAPPTFKAKGYEYTLYGQFQHGILDVGSVTIPGCQSGSKALERLELTFHKGRFRRAALVNYRDDKFKKLVIQCVEDGVDYNQAMLTNSKANAEVSGPYSVATRSIEGEGVSKCRIVSAV